MLAIIKTFGVLLGLAAITGFWVGLSLWGPEPNSPSEMAQAYLVGAAFATMGCLMLAIWHMNIAWRSSHS